MAASTYSPFSLPTENWDEPGIELELLGCQTPSFCPSRNCQKQLNAQMAAMQGKLKFKPMDMGPAMKLSKLLS